MWYSEGTVAVDSGSTNIVGTGTSFLTNTRVGDGITITGSTALHEIIGVASNTQISIRPAYDGPTGSGLTYGISPLLGYDKDLSDAFNQLRLQFGDDLANLQLWATADTVQEARAALGASESGNTVFTGTPEEAREALGLSAPVFKRVWSVANESQLSTLNAGVGDQASVSNIGLFDLTESGWVQQDAGNQRVTTSTGTQTVAEALNDRPVMDSPQNHGARGDGTSDDTDAILSFLASPGAKYWGDENNTYRVTATIEAVLPSAMFWLSAGARILFDPPTNQRYGVHVFVQNDTNQLIGALNFDGGNKCVEGFAFGNADGSVASDSIDAPNLYVEGLASRDVYRASTEFPGGNGIIIRGRYNQVILQRPIVERVKMAAGAGVSGSQGVFGITVSEGGTVGANYVRINDPFVNEVYSDDPDYVFDQDGIRIVQSSVDEGDILNPARAIVSGGEIRNCRNRSVKMQGRDTLVEKVKLVRQASVVGTAASIAPDIDFQRPGGIANDITIYYDGVTPGRVVNSTARENAFGFTTPYVDGVRGVVKNATLPNVVSLTALDSSIAVDWTSSIDNIDIKGLVGSFGSVRSTNEGFSRISFNHCYANIQECLVDFQDSWQGDARFLFLDCHNTGDTVASLFANNLSPAGNKIYSCISCDGFTNDGVRLTNTNQPTMVQRVHALAPENGSTNAGLTRLFSENLAPDEVYTLPHQGTTGQTTLILLSVSAARTGQAILAVDNFGVDKISLLGTAVETGTSSEPSSGDFRAWSEGSSGGIKFSNRSGTSRRFTGWRIG